MSHYSLKIGKVRTYTSLRRNRTRHLGVSYGTSLKLASLRVTKSACPGLSRLVCNILYPIYRFKYSSVLLLSPVDTLYLMQISRGIAGLHSELVFPVKHASVALSPLSGLGSTRPEGSLGNLSFPPQTPPFFFTRLSITQVQAKNAATSADPSRLGS
jgi:hypothetical protein